MGVTQSTKKELMGELRSCKSVMASKHNFTDAQFKVAVEEAIRQFKLTEEIEGDQANLEMFKELLNTFLAEVQES